MADKVPAIKLNNGMEIPAIGLGTYLVRRTFCSSYTRLEHFVPAVRSHVFALCTHIYTDSTKMEINRCSTSRVALVFLITCRTQFDSLFR